MGVSAHAAIPKAVLRVRDNRIVPLSAIRYQLLNGALAIHYVPEIKRAPTTERNFWFPVIANYSRPLSVVAWFGKSSRKTSGRLYFNFHHHPPVQFFERKGASDARINVSPR